LKNSRFLVRFFENRFSEWTLTFKTVNMVNMVNIDV